MQKLKEEWSKIKNIIHVEKDKEQLDKESEKSSYSNFLFHYKDPFNALKKDVDNIKDCKLSKEERHFIWFFFLGIIPLKTPNAWRKILADTRKNYKDLKEELITKDIETFIEMKRIHNSYNYDNYKTILKKEEFDLLHLIKVDVDRTYQDNEIFLLDVIKKKLITVLYIYAKKNPNFGYKQGMNDICGVFLYVLYKDFYLKDNFIKDETSTIYYIFHSNNAFLENDLYLVFSLFMSRGIAEFFLYNNINYKNNILGSKSLEDKLSLSVDEIMNCGDSALKKRAYVLYYKKFHKIDFDLYELLISQVEPELFLVRWYLCVFTREFNIEQVVYLWDLIIMYEFVENKFYKNNMKTHYNFMDCICLSMLQCCKPNVIKKEDINELLSSIMHYPTNIPIEKICKRAIEIYSKLNPDIKV